MKQIPQHTLDFIDSWLELTTKWQETAGLSVAIMHKSKFVLERSYGKANIENNEVLTDAHLTRIASQSKTFTATAILQLQELGSLHIDDHIVDYLPWLKDHKDKRWNEVTIRQLMSHSAGVIRDGQGEGFWSLRTEFPDEQALQQAILESDLILMPNTKMKYSNFGFGLLGMVVAYVSGMTYNDYVKKHIIDELGLKNTSPEYAEGTSIATGYSRRNLKRERFAFPRIKTNALAPATGFYSTPHDMCVFFDALKVGSGKLLNDETKREMHRRQWEVSKKTDFYGLGLTMGERHDVEFIGHSGGFPGFGSRTWLAPQEDIIVSVVVTDYDTPTDPMTSSIFAIVKEFGDEVPREDHLKYEGRFLGLHDGIEVVAHAGGLRRIYPIGWWPMNTVDKLRVIDDTTLEIYDTNGFEDDGEKIIYKFDKDKRIEHINEAGTLRTLSIDNDLVPWW